MMPEKICRVCLKAAKTMHDLFGSNEAQLERGKMTVADFIRLLLQAPVEDEEGLPSKICQACYLEFQRFYTFKTKCERSNAVLVQLRNVKIKIKKLKSDASTDTTKKKPAVFNGITQNKNDVRNSNVALSEDKKTENRQQWDSARRNEHGTNYVEFIDDPLNLIEFEQLSGPELNTPWNIRLADVEIKEEVESNSSSDETSQQINNFNKIRDFTMIDLSSAPTGTSTRSVSSVANSAAGSETAEEKNYECPACPYVHISSDGLEKHMVRNHMIGTSCAICKKEISGNPRPHFARHMGPQVDYDEVIEGTTLLGSDFQCLNCPQHFKRAFELQEHVAKGHCFAGNQLASNFDVNTTLALDENGFTKVDTSDLFSELIEESFDDQQQSSSSGNITVKDNKLLASLLNDSRNKLFSCDLCTKIFVSQDDLNLHTVTAHTVQNVNGQKAFKCTSCSNMFNEKSDLITHMKTHESEKPYQCEYCPQTFRFRHNLESHVRFKHCAECKGAKNVSCKTCTPCRPSNECDICHKIFANRTGLMRHKKVHSQGKPYKCEHCSQSFNYKQILNLHVKEKHANSESIMDSELRCKICSRVYGRKIDLIQHMKSHEGSKQFQCTACPKSFDSQALLVLHTSSHTLVCAVCSEKCESEQHLRTHVAQKHSNSTNETGCFKCGECKKMFAVKNHYEEHILSHKQENQFECGVCKQSFRYAQSLNRHTKLYHSNEAPVYQCQVCPRTFADRSELVKHFPTHKSEKSFDCEVCGEKFVDKLRLGAHMVLMHDAKKMQTQHFKCEHCGTIFWYKNLYDAHIRSHPVEGLFICDICNSSFRFQQSLKQHLDKVHPDVMLQSGTEKSAVQVDNTNDLTTLINESGTIYENSENVCNFAFGESFLHDDQILKMDGPESIMSELFDESSIEVA